MQKFKITLTNANGAIVRTMTARHVDAIADAVAALAIQAGATVTAAAEASAEAETGWRAWTIEGHRIVVTKG